MGVADNGGAPRADVVDVLVAVHVPGVSALDAVEEDGLTTHRAEGANGRIHSARHEFLSTRESRRKGKRRIRQATN